MTMLTLPISPPAYELEDDLVDVAPLPSAVQNPDPGELAREDLLINKLGARGWVRVHHFRNFYGSGWGDDGRTLSPRALDAFFRFIEEANFPVRYPSVFLTDQGGLELCWEDAAGNSLQVEFTSAGAEFYKGATNEEGSVTIEHLGELARRLAS